MKKWLDKFQAGGDVPLITTKKGNVLGTNEWKTIQASKKSMFSDPVAYMDWLDGWANPSEFNVANVAAKAFQEHAKLKTYTNSPDEIKKRKVNIPFSGHWKDEEYTVPGKTAAQNRAIDSTNFVKKYRTDNNIITQEEIKAKEIAYLKSIGVMKDGGAINKIPKAQKGKKVSYSEGLDFKALMNPGIKSDNTKKALSKDQPKINIDYNRYRVEQANKEKEKLRKLELAKKGQTDLTNAISDFGTIAMTNITQFKMPSEEELEAGRSGWEERLPLIAENVSWGLGNELTGGAMNQVGPLLSKAKPALKKAGKNIYKLNPYAEKLNNPNSSYRVAGLDALEDFQNTGVLRSQNTNPGEIVKNTNFLLPPRTTAFPSFQKGYADMSYLPKNGGVVFKTDLPTYKRGDINPVTGSPIKGRHYAHRVIDSKTGVTLSEIPASDVKVYGSEPHWLKGYKEIPKNSKANQSFFSKSGKIENTEDANQWLANWNDHPENVAKRNHYTSLGNLKYNTFKGDINPPSDRLFPFEDVRNIKTKNYIDLLKEKGISPKTLEYQITTGGVSYPTKGDVYINNKMYAFNKGKKESVKVHELTHQFENNGISFNEFEEEDLLEPFGVSPEQYFSKIAERGNKKESYFLDPTEIHARINQSRYENGLKPGQEYTKEMFNNSYRQNKFNGMGKYIKDKEKAFELFKNFYTASPLILGSGVAASQLQQKKNGGVIEDDRGQWAHPGKITKINSNQITMQGVPYPVLGISDTGDIQMMQPDKEYIYDGKSVTEFPMAKNGAWLNKYN